MMKSVDTFHQRKLCLVLKLRVCHPERFVELRSQVFRDNEICWRGSRELCGLLPIARNMVMYFRQVYLHLREAGSDVGTEDPDIRLYIKEKLPVSYISIMMLEAIEVKGRGVEEIQGFRFGDGEEIKRNKLSVPLLFPNINIQIPRVIQADRHQDQEIREKNLRCAKRNEIFQHTAPKASEWPQSISISSDSIVA
jgi:hypothetical protein